MKVYVDSESRIKAVGSTEDTSLMELTINDDDNPFSDWSVAKICCYKVTVSDGFVTMFTPYRPSSSLDYIDSLGNDIAIKESQITELDNTVTNLNTQVEELNTEITTKDTQISELNTEVTDLNTQVSELTEEVAVNADKAEAFDILIGGAE
jgi:septal ring factor EnvC (AmiA/AmiB activator)